MSFLPENLLANWVVWFYLISDLISLLPRITCASWPIGNPPSIRSLGAALPVHIPILGKLGRQSVSTLPRLEFNSSDFSSTSADFRGKQKQGEGERAIERDRETLYLSMIYEYTITRVQINYYIYHRLFFRGLFGINKYISTIKTSSYDREEWIWLNIYGWLV